MVIFVNAKIALILLAVFGVNLVVTRYVSLGSILMAVLYPVMMWLFYKDIVLVCIALVFTLIVVIAHRDNIKRLLNGTENKISFGKKSKKRNKKADLFNAEQVRYFFICILLRLSVVCAFCFIVNTGEYIFSVSSYRNPVVFF